MPLITASARFVGSHNVMHTLASGGQQVTADDSCQ